MNLKSLRKNKNIKQSEIAKSLNITAKTYSNYENENTDPNIQTLIKLADLFHVTLDELVGRKQENVIDKGLLRDEELNIIEIMHDLNKINLNRLESYAVALYQTQEDQNEIIKRVKGNK